MYRPASINLMCWAVSEGKVTISYIRILMRKTKFGSTPVEHPTILFYILLDILEMASLYPDVNRKFWAKLLLRVSYFSARNRPKSQIIFPQLDLIEGQS